MSNNENQIMVLVSEIESKYTSNQTSTIQPLITHLDNLGYLISSSITVFNFQSEIEKAYSLFYKDLEESKLLKPSEEKKTEEIFGIDSRTKLVELAIDIDEGFTFNSLPSFGTTSLISRMIHYRLKLLGLYTYEVNRPYSGLTYSALTKLGSYINKTKLAAINLVANMQKFTTEYLKINGYKHCLSVFKVPENIDTSNYPDYSGKFKRTLKKNLAKHQEIFDELDDKIFFRKDDKVNEQYLNRLLDDELNSFTLRLIQIHQWMSGFYNGDIDSYFGPKSIASLTAIIDSYKETYQERIKTEEILVKIKDSIFLFNSLFFLEEYKEESYSADKTIETLSIINDEYIRANDKDKKTFEKLLNDETGVLKNISNQAWQPIDAAKRAFTGIKTFFKKIFRFAGKIFKWIVDKLEKFADIIKNFVRNLFEYIKLAVRHFVNGVKFLIGKLPVITSNENGTCNYTNFDIDKDMVSIFENKVQGEIKDHISAVHRQVKSMEFSLSVISLFYGILRTLLAGTTLISLPVFLFKLTKAFKIVIDKYKLIVTI